MLILGFEYALYANMSQGVITTLYSFTTVFLGVFGYFIFNEKLDGYQVVGIITLVGCVILLAFSGSASTETIVIVGGKEHERVSSLLPIMFAIMTTLYFLFRSLTVKAYTIKFETNSPYFTSISQGIVGIGFVIIFFAAYGINGIDSVIIRDAILGGFFQGIGGFLVIHAISVGYSGPASALVSIQSVLQTILDAVLFGRIPNYFELIGLFLGIFGAFTLTIGPNIVQIIKNKF